MKSMFLLAAAVIAAPIASVAAQPAMTAATYMTKAGAGDQYEIQSSKVLLQSTTNPQLKTFANMMVMDHTKSTADVKHAAMVARLWAPAPKLDAKGAADVAALRRAHGMTRDRLYVAQQKAAHAKALALHQGYANNGKVASLRATASKIVPVVESHSSELSSM